MSTKRGMVKRLCEIDGADFRRPVVVRLRRIKTDQGEVSELEFRALGSRHPVRIGMLHLARLALQDKGECACLAGAFSMRKDPVDHPELPLMTKEAA